MNKKLLIILTLAISFFTIKAQETIEGWWMWTHIVEKNTYKQTRIDVLTIFTEDGKVLQPTLHGSSAVATYEYFAHENRLVLKSEFSDDFNGCKAVTIPTAEGIMEISINGNFKYIFEEIDLECLAANHKFSSLNGAWYLNSPDIKNHNMIVFRENAEFEVYFFDEDEKTIAMSNGFWFYNHLEKDILLVSASMLTFKGRFLLIDIDDKTKALTTKDREFSLKRITTIEDIQ